MDYDDDSRSASSLHAARRSDISCLPGYIQQDDAFRKKPAQMPEPEPARQARMDITSVSTYTGNVIQSRQFRISPEEPEMLA